MSSVDLPNGTLRYRVERLERDLAELNSEIDRLTQKIDARFDRLEERANRLLIAAVAGVFTFAGAILLLALNLIVSRGV